MQNNSQSMWSTYYPFFSNPNATIPTVSRKSFLITWNRRSGHRYTRVLIIMCTSNVSPLFILQFIFIDSEKQLPPPVFTKATTSSPNMQPTASTLSTWVFTFKIHYLLFLMNIITELTTYLIVYEIKSGSAFAGLACVSNAYALAIGCIVLLIFYCLMVRTS